MNEKFIPKLRFSGFINDWEEVTLNDIATFSKGKGISKNDISNEGIYCVRYGELYTKYGELIYDIDSKTDLDKNELILSDKDDILIPCSGETAIDLATASCIQKDQIAIGGDITIIKTNQYAPFITYYLNQKRTEIARYAQGVSIVHLYPKDFKVLTIKIPSIKEQKKIISLLEIVTKKEKLLENKYQEYQNFKVYLMQQIFTQKLRFQDFEDEWIETTLKKISVKIGDGLHSTPDYVEKSEYYFINGNNLLEGQIIINSNTKCISQYEFEKYNNNLNKNTILISINGTIGNLAYYNNENVILGKSAAYIKLNENIDKEFIYNYLKIGKIQHYFSSELTGSTIKNLSLKTLKNTPIIIPSYNEQKMIADMFKNIDSKITLINNRLNYINNFKKGLLQKMFI